MSLRSLGLLVGLASGLVAQAAAAQTVNPRISSASPYSVEDNIGQVILYFVDGRTQAEAFRTSNDFDPFQIRPADLLYTVRGFFITYGYDGKALREGELALFPQFRTPREAFEPSEPTPAIIPFALMQMGTCHAGYVTGHPVPDTIRAVDLTGEICHAATVEELVFADYASAHPDVAEAPADEPVADETAPAEAPAFDVSNPTGVDLDVIVWAAYNAAYNHALADGDYLFARGDDYPDLRAAILAEVTKEGYGGVSVPAAPSISLAEALSCAPAGTTELRVQFVAGNAGIVLVAASDRLKSSYRYDPIVSPELEVASAGDCHAAGPGRAGAVNVP